MARCKYVGRGYDQWLPRGEQCDQEVRLVADKSKGSQVFRQNKMTNVFYPSMKCPSGFCEYHWNKIRCKKRGVGRQS